MEKAEFNKLFGAFLRHKRLQLNLSQMQLAYKMELDYQYISRVERGLITPTLYWIMGLTKAMDINLDQFISEFYGFIQKSQ
jgi:transcriptional regulator with XRE-family HTH domain